MSKLPNLPTPPRKTEFPIIPPSIKVPLKRPNPRKSYIPPGRSPKSPFFDEQGNSVLSKPQNDGKKKLSTWTGSLNSLPLAFGGVGTRAIHSTRQLHSSTIRELVNGSLPLYPAEYESKTTIHDVALHPLTREALVSTTKSLLHQPYHDLHILDPLPSVNSGIIALSCPYKGADTYLFHLAEGLAGSTNAQFMVVNNRDIFERIPPQKVLAARLERPGDSGRRRSSNTVVLPQQARMGNISGVLLPPAGFEEQEEATIPYPFNRPYISKDTPMVHFLNNPPTPPHKSPASVFTQQLEIFFRSLYRKKSPLVILWQDFSLLFARTPDLTENDIIQALVGCMEDARNRRPIVLLLPWTTLIDKNPKPSPLEQMLKSGRDDVEEIRGKGGKKEKPISYETPLDKFVGIVRLPVLPPTQAHIVQWHESHNAFVNKWNWREIETTLAWSSIKLKGESWQGMGDILLDVQQVEQIALQALGKQAEQVKSIKVEVKEKETDKWSMDAPVASVRQTANIAAQALVLDTNVVLEAYNNVTSTTHLSTASHPHLAKNLTGLNRYEENILRESLVDPTTVSTGGFDDIGGLGRTKAILQDLVRLPLLHPQHFQGVLAQSTTGILLFGPPGTGKTLLAKAVAQEAGVNMLAISPSVVSSMFVGENEKYAKAVFSLARKLSPCIVFIDEIDALLQARHGGMRSWERNTLNELMQEWDGLRTSKSVLIIGATNRPFDLDEAVLRRLPRRVLVSLPTEQERREILDVLLRDEDVQDRQDLIQRLAHKTKGWSGSDIKNLCIASALISVREAVVEGGNRVLKWSHFEHAMDQGDVVPSVSEKADLMKHLKQWDQQYGSKGNKYEAISIGF